MRRLSFGQNPDDHGAEPSRVSWWTWATATGATLSDGFPMTPHLRAQTFWAATISASANHGAAVRV
jgi:hypothetical protein